MASPKRQRPPSDAKYPRKRSLKACQVCRGRKTKCDNVRPTCSFCSSVGIACTYDDDNDTLGQDHSTFDPASLEILRKLAQVAQTQEELLQTVREQARAPYPSEHADECQCPSCLPAAHPQHRRTSGAVLAVTPGGTDVLAASTTLFDDFDFDSAYRGLGLDPNSAATTPVASASVAAERWFGLLANSQYIAPDHTHQDTGFSAEDAPPDDSGPGGGGGGGFLDLFNGQNEDEMTPLQRATKIIDGPDASTWQAPQNIHMLHTEQVLFEHFINRICSWLDLFDPVRNFSTRVPHLAIRNAGLLNAILALSSYHQCLSSDGGGQESTGQISRNSTSTAVQYYYQSLHYVQKAMRYPSYQASPELMATTMIISTYEMLRGSRKDWQQHLQGVFWILRSRQIEVEACSLESTTWWAWLRQDIWVAFRERRRTYSTWAPKKTYAELSGNIYEIASRAVWILAQVVNFCAAQPADGPAAQEDLQLRFAWVKLLRKMLREWESHLTVEFSPLPASIGSGDIEIFTPRLIHPQCLGVAMQVHHVSRILVCAHEPSVGGNLLGFTRRNKVIQESIEMVCGIGMTLIEDAASMMSCQCLFIAGVFIQDMRKRERVLEMLNSRRNSWPTPSLASELQAMWCDTEDSWENVS